MAFLEWLEVHFNRNISSLAKLLSAGTINSY